MYFYLLQILLSENKVTYLLTSFFFNKVPAWRSATLLKQRLRHRCFSENFAKFLRTPILLNICERLLLKTEASRVTTRPEDCQKFDFFVHKSWCFCSKKI